MTLAPALLRTLAPVGIAAIDAALLADECFRAWQVNMAHLTGNDFSGRLRAAAFFSGCGACISAVALAAVPPHVKHDEHQHNDDEVLHGFGFLRAFEDDFKHKVRTRIAQKQQP